MSTRTQIDPEFEELLAYIEANRGFDFTGYKRPSLVRRTRKRMQALAIDDYGAYLDHLESNPDEFAELFDTILINVTGFFREREPWEYVQNVLLPRILASKSPMETVRVWCPGAASGEEAYTAAMIFAEVLGGKAPSRLRVYATDVDEDALNKGRLASYTSKEVEDVPERYRRKYFERRGARYEVGPDLRRSVIFGRHDLVQDAPISRVDFLICRNMLMYLNAETQDRVLQKLNLALTDDGYLFLGKSETLPTRLHLFKPVDFKRRVFQRVPRGELREGIRAFAQPDAAGHEAPELLAAAGFEAGAAAQLVVDRQGTLMLANQHARILFGLASSDVGRPLQDLEVSCHPAELRSVIQDAYAERRPVTVRDVSWDGAAGSRVFDLQATPLVSRGGDVLGASVTYVDVTRYSALRDELERSKAALEQAYREVQSTNEELETTNEELQSTNAELETTNEELQATNAELERMNEGLQSTNAELETMNKELREQTSELNRVNAFLETVLTGLGAAVVVLDGDFRVLAWNATAEAMWGLEFEDVRDRSFLGLDLGLPIDALRTNVGMCLKGTGPNEVVLPAVDRRGQRIRCRLQCKPLPEIAANRQGVLLLLEQQPVGGEE
jgi:two-component system CheB/CheR fusion protein